MTTPCFGSATRRIREQQFVPEPSPSWPKVRWVAHGVRLHRTGTKRFHHPLVGDVTLAYEALDLSGDPGQRMVIYTAEPASASQYALDLLASWASTPQATLTDEVRADS